MKVVLVFALLFAVVLCRPASKVSISSSESSEEVVRQLSTAQLSQSQSSSLQHVSAFSNSDESNENEQEAPEVRVQMKVTSVSASVSTSLSTSVSNSVSAMVSSSTQSPDSRNSQDSDDDDNDDEEKDNDETGESETEEDSSSSESGEASTVTAATISPVIVTDDVTAATIVEEATHDPMEPTIVTDDTVDSGRGDSLGSYPSEYKTIVYVEDKSYHKLSEPHKSWDYVSKKSGYVPIHGNEIDKAFKFYKGLQVHQELLEEDTSTPEVESQSLDTSSGLSQDLSPRRASLHHDSRLSENSLSDGSSSGNSGNTGEEDMQTKADSIRQASATEESASTAEESTSASEESLEVASQSSEEATAMPGATDNQSVKSDSDESLSDEVQPEITTELPVVITAK